MQIPQIDVWNRKFPPFDIDKGQYVSIKMPFLYSSDEMNMFVQKLLAYIQGNGASATYAAYKEPAFFARLFGVRSVCRYSKRVLGAETDTWSRMGCKPQQRLDHLAFTDKRMLALSIEAIAYDFILFDTAGLDPMGASRVREFAKSLVQSNKGLIEFCVPNTLEPFNYSVEDIFTMGSRDYS